MWRYALWTVACMEHMKSIRDRAEVEFPRDAVGTGDSGSCPYHPISVSLADGSDPDPASGFGFFADFFPEALR